MLDDMAKAFQNGKTIIVDGKVITNRTDLEAAFRKKNGQYKQ
jgi:hypothetical protein